MVNDNDVTGQAMEVSQDDEQSDGVGVGNLSMDIALDIPLIFELILKNLPVRDLLTCSLVNRRWNVTARTILRDHKKCFARTDSVKSCSELIPWYAEMTQMAIPFNGLYINFRCWKIHDTEECSQILPLEFLTRELPLKYVHINGIESSCPPQCAAVSFVRKVVQTRTLEELSVTQACALCFVYEPWRVLFDREVVLPLKVLRLPDQIICHSQALMRRLISVAPNLRHLDYYVTPKDVAFLPESKWWIVKKLKLDPTGDCDGALYQKVASSELQLIGICIGNRAPVQTAISPASMLAWKSLEQILISSSSSLRSIHLTIPVAVKLMALRLQPLPNVNELILDVGGYYEDRPSLPLLRRFNFSHLFPQLSSISVYCNRPTLLKYQDCEDVAQTTDDFTSNITKISLRGPLFLVISYLARIFPHITTVSVSDGHANAQSFWDVWRLWPKIQHFHIGQRLILNSCAGGSLDSAFCGLNQEEVLELRKKSSEFLKAVHIVPPHPAAMHMRNLKKVEVVDDARVGGQGHHHSLTKVAELLVFQRMPCLSVDIKYQDEAGNAMDVSP